MHHALLALGRQHQPRAPRLNSLDLHLLFRQRDGEVLTERAEHVPVVLGGVARHAAPERDAVRVQRVRVVPVAVAVAVARVAVAHPIAHTIT